MKLALVAAILATVPVALVLAQQGMPPVPGLFNAAGPDGSLLGRGFDPIYQKPRGAVVSFHYTNLNGDYNQWTDPLTNMTYSVPDELTVFETPAAETVLANAVFTSFTEYQSFSQHESSSSFSLFVFSFSKSDASTYIKQVLESSSHVVGFARHISVSTKLSMFSSEVMQYMMKSGNQAGNVFTQQMLSLPTSMSTPQQVADYSAFVSQFGTHYAEAAFYGGALDVFLVVNSSYVSQYGMTETESQFSIGLDLVFLAFGFASGGSHISGSLSADFKSSTDVVMVAYGGDPALVQESQYDSWAGTVAINPAPINVTYRPITDLVFDPTRASLLNQATTSYLNTAPPADSSFCGAPIGFNIPGVNIPNAPGSVQEAKTRRYSLDQIEAMVAARKSKPAAAPKPKAAVPAKAVAARKAAAKAIEPVPGVTSGIGRGYDAKSGTVLLPVAQLGYEQNKQWYDAITGQYYAIPDGVSFEATPAVCFTENMVSIDNDTAAWNFVSHAAGGYIGLAIDGIGIGLSFSEETQKFRSITNNYTDALTMLQRGMTLYSLSFGDSTLNLDPMLSRMISALPEVAGPEYQQLIQYWGTHYISNTYFGGYCNFTVAYEKSFVKDKSWSYISEQVGLQLGYQMNGIGITLDLGFGLSKMTGTVDQAFKAISTSNYFCVGGDASALADKNYNLWVQSLNNAPAMIPNTMQIRPISDFVYDVNKRALLQDAIVAYLS